MNPHPTTPAGERDPLLHRFARRWSEAGLRGADRVWKLAMKLRPLPEQAIVQITPDTNLPICGVEHVGRMIYQGRYERAEMALLPLVLSPGSLAIDIGANIGFYAFQMAALVGHQGRVLAFEPSPSCLRVLVPSIEGADLPQLTLHRVALGGETGEGDLVDVGGPTNAGLSTLRSDTPSDLPSARVQVRRLDEFVGEDELIDLIKIDVEGYEEQVLAGCARLFDEGRVRFLLLEVSPEFGDVRFVGRFLSDHADRYQAYLVHLRRGIFRWHPGLIRLHPDQICRRASQMSILIGHADQVAALQPLFPRLGRPKTR